jgi:hypothetical protein
VKRVERSETLETGGMCADVRMLKEATSPHLMSASQTGLNAVLTRQNTGQKRAERPSYSLKGRPTLGPVAELGELVEDQDTVVHQCSRMYLDGLG